MLARLKWAVSSVASALKRTVALFVEQHQPIARPPAQDRPKADKHFMGAWKDPGGRHVLYVAGGCMCSFHVEEISPEKPGGLGPLSHPDTPCD